VSYRKIGLFYHPREAAARRLAASLQHTVLSGIPASWIAQTGDEAAVGEHLPDTDLLICIGGDGTVLWAARTAGRLGIPIISVNMGRLGFLSEVDPEHAAEQVVGLLEGAGIVEERTMLECSLPGTGALGPGQEPLIALNDVVIGRAAPGRPVYLSVAVDAVHLARVRADGIIVCTGTGSTAYNLSAGGPVMMPRSRELLLTPVAPHLSRMRPIVLPSDSVIEIEVDTDHGAVVSVDGQIDQPLENGSVVVVRRSPHVARFIRLGPPGEFFNRLAHHLNLSTRHGESTV
jgi:NAD+ kinase